MFAIDILRRGRHLLADARAWTKGVLARDANGNETAALSDAAVCFCLDGAMHRVEQTDPEEPMTHDHLLVDRLLDDAAKELFPDRLYGDNGSFVNFNDHDQTTHADALAVIDRAILLADAQ